MKHDIMVCPSCRKPVGFRFGEFGLVFHWIENYYCVDVVLLLYGCAPFVLFREVWVLGANGAKRHEQRFMA